MARISKELGDLLDQVDAGPLVVNSSVAGGAAPYTNCGGGCYQGCKAANDQLEYNLPNTQPSLDKQREPAKGQYEKTQNK